MKKLTVILVAALLSAAGCGGGSSSSTPTAPSPMSPAPTAPSSPRILLAGQSNAFFLLPYLPEALDFTNIDASINARTEDALREGKLALDLLPPSKDASVSLMLIEDMARVCVLVGRPDIALDNIEWLLSVPGRFSIRLLELDPIWDPLRGLPRYRKLMDRYAGAD